MAADYVEERDGGYYRGTRISLNSIIPAFRAGGSAERNAPPLQPDLRAKLLRIRNETQMNRLA